MSGEPLVQRAARYFGLHREPRVSIPLGDGRTAIVATRWRRKVLAIHVPPDTGLYLLLTERQRRALIEALGGTALPAEREASTR